MTIEGLVLCVGEGEQVMRQRVRKDLVDVESWTRCGALHMLYNDELNFTHGVPRSAHGPAINIGKAEAPRRDLRGAMYF